MDRIFTYAELGPLLGIPYSRVHIMRKVKDGTFPVPVRIGAHRVGWLGEELARWRRERAAERGPAGAVMVG